MGARLKDQPAVRQSTPGNALTEGSNTMGQVKALAEASKAAALTLAELLSNGISVVIACDARSNSYTWYIAPEGAEYEQDDWIFNAPKRGKAATLDEAIEGLTAAVIQLYPYCDFAKARKPKPSRRRSVA